MVHTLALSLQPLISQLTSLRLDSSLLDMLLDPSLLVMLATGLGVGVVAAVLGIGGGLIMVPVLTLSGASPVQAVATSLLGVLFGAFSGTLHNWRSGNLKLVHVALLAPAAVVTTEFGVALANAAPPRALLVAFAALLLSAIWLIHLKNRLSARTAAKIAANPDAMRGAPPKTTDEAFIFRGTGIGALAGVLAGLFGVGGGVVMVPLQLLYLGESIKEAVRTSLGVVALVAVWALGRHALAGNVLWPEGIALGLGSLVGAQFGARLLSALPDALINLLFRALLLVLTAYMLFEAARWG